MGDDRRDAALRLAAWAQLLPWGADDELLDQLATYGPVPQLGLPDETPEPDGTALYAKFSAYAARVNARVPQDPQPAQGS